MTIKARHSKSFRYQVFRIVNKMRSQYTEEQIKKDLKVSWVWLRNIRNENPAGAHGRALLDLDLLTPEEREEYSNE